MKDSYYVISDMHDVSKMLADETGGKIRRYGNVEKYEPKLEGFSFYKRSYLQRSEGAEKDLKDIEDSDSTLITVVDESVDEDLLSGLEVMGFHKMVTQTAMVCDLKDIGKEIHDEVRIVDEKDGKEWIECCKESFGKPDDPAFDLFVKNKDSVLLGYYLDGKIVGTTMLYVKGDNAGIHEVGVLKKYRRRKIASVLVKAAMRIGKEKGAQYATLQASPAGELTYATIGFRKTGSVSTYVRG